MKYDKVVDEAALPFPDDLPDVPDEGPLVRAAYAICQKALSGQDISAEMAAYDQAALDFAREASDRLANLRVMTMLDQSLGRKDRP